MRLLAAAVLVLPLALVGCGHGKKKLAPAPLPVERPLVALEAARVSSLGFGGAALEFDCRIENPNPFPISVTKVSYALAIEDRRAARGGSSEGLAIAPAVAGVAGRGAVVVPVAVRFSDVPAFAPLLARDADAAYALTGEVTFLTPAGKVTVPLAKAGRLELPRAPRIQVARLVLRSASPREVRLEMAVDVRNPNAFPIPHGRIRYGLFLAGKEVARTDVAVEEIPAGGAAAIAVPIQISVLKAGTAAAKLLIPFQSLDAGVRGKAEFGGVPVPLDLGARIVPDR